MATQTKIAISQVLDQTEITTDGSFDYSHVLDLRCNLDGSARPVEETVLKRLKNHFISYDQQPVKKGSIHASAELKLYKMLTELTGKALLVVDDVAHAASLLSMFDVSFESKVFYVVETGKGDIVRSITPTPPSYAPEVAIAS
ncbi:MAG: hypothetical protein ACR2O3_03835 [Rhizobiaceae bacterium]